MRLIDADALIPLIKMGECNMYDEYCQGRNGGIEFAVNQVKQMPTIEERKTGRLTDDDFETIRIHLNAYKEKLCNQQRWGEAEEYQRIIDRFMAFASAQTENEERKEESAQNVSKEDLVSRKAAIDAHYEYCNKHPDAGFPVWSLKILEDLPSAQPEIIRCGDCKYFKVEYAWNCASYPICEVSPQRIITPDDYCSFAERGTDERSN